MKPPSPNDPPPRPIVKSALVLAVGILSAIYWINPGAGVFEIFPDNVPGLGNLDEATAVALLISALAYFGVDMCKVTDLFGSKKKQDK